MVRKYFLTLESVSILYMPRSRCYSDSDSDDDSSCKQCRKEKPRNNCCHKEKCRNCFRKNERCYNKSNCERCEHKNKKEKKYSASCIESSDIDYLKKNCQDGKLILITIS